MERGPCGASFSDSGSRWPSVVRLGTPCRCDANHPGGWRAERECPGPATTCEAVPPGAWAWGLDDGWKPEPGEMTRCPGPHPRRVCRLPRIISEHLFVSRSFREFRRWRIFRLGISSTCGRLRRRGRTRQLCKRRLHTSLGTTVQQPAARIPSFQSCNLQDKVKNLVRGPREAGGDSGVRAARYPENLRVKEGR
jgi:hypothetical protein